MMPFGAESGVPAGRRFPDRRRRRHERIRIKRSIGAVSPFANRDDRVRRPKAADGRPASNNAGLFFSSSLEPRGDRYRLLTDGFIVSVRGMKIVNRANHPSRAATEAKRTPRSSTFLRWGAGRRGRVHLRGPLAFAALAFVIGGCLWAFAESAERDERTLDAPAKEAAPADPNALSVARRGRTPRGRTPPESGRPAAEEEAFVDVVIDEPFYDGGIVVDLSAEPEEIPTVKSTITGVIVDESGAPVPDLTVVLRFREDPNGSTRDEDKEPLSEFFTGCESISGTTNNDGRFVIERSCASIAASGRDRTFDDFGAGDIGADNSVASRREPERTRESVEIFDLAAADVRRGSLRRFALRAPRGGDRMDLGVLAMTRGAVVTGRVVFESGRPLPRGFEVTATATRPGSTDTPIINFWERDPFTMRFPPAYGDEQEGELHARSWLGEDGSFDLSGLQSGETYILVVSETVLLMDKAKAPLRDFCCTIPGSILRVHSGQKDPGDWNVCVTYESAPTTSPQTFAHARGDASFWIGNGQRIIVTVAANGASTEMHFETPPVGDALDLVLDP